MRRVLMAGVLVATAACGTTTEAPEETTVYAHDFPKHNVPRSQDTPESFVVPTTRQFKKKVSRSRSAPPVDRNQSIATGNTGYSGDERTVSSTAYCLTSRTADGGRGFVGSVAMNGVPLGSKWMVVGTGVIYTVTDRIGHGSGFDVWMPSCDAARQYGRRTVTVRRVG